MRFSAEASFAGVQGRLFAPSSYVEYLNVVQGIMFTFHRDYTWYAFSDAAVEGRWAVMTGPYIGTDMFELIPWEKGEPNGGTGENCACIAPGHSWAVDIACSRLLKYIIEFKCPFGQRFNDHGTACIGMLESGCFFVWVFTFHVVQTTTWSATTISKVAAGCSFVTTASDLSRAGIAQQTVCAVPMCTATPDSASTPSTTET